MLSMRHPFMFDNDRHTLFNEAMAQLLARQTNVTLCNRTLISKTALGDLDGCVQQQQQHWPPMLSSMSASRDVSRFVELHVLPSGGQLRGACS
jgi:hypothetical protein